MFLNQKIVTSFFNGEMHEECISMVLSQNTEDSPIIFKGKGYIKQNKSKSIHFTIYSIGAHDTRTEERFFPESIGIPGQIVSADKYYTLEVINSFGKRWRAERIIPDFNPSYLEDGTHVIAKGKIHSFESQEQEDWIDCHSLAIAYFIDVDFPCNEVTESNVIVAGREARKSRSRDIAKFDNSFGTFELATPDSYLIVKFNSDKPIPENFVAKISEGLSFVFARPMWWNAIVRLENGKECISLRNVKRNGNCEIRRPVKKHDIVFHSNIIWELFGKYLTFICDRNLSVTNELSRHLLAIQESSNGGISGFGLALSVAVEGVAKVLYPGIVTISKQFKAVVKELKAHVQAWIDSQKPSEAIPTTERMDSLLNQLTQISAKSILYELVSKNVLSNNDILSWNALRNKLAHGAPASNDKQEMLNLCNRCMLIIYKMIYDSIGYLGPYTDYSTLGWPTIGVPQKIN